MRVIRCTLLVALAPVLAFDGTIPATPPRQESPASSVPATPSTKPQGPMADNSRCFVCHANYDFDEEKLVFLHARANIGCVRCHGESPRHSADEDGLTPPDQMYSKGMIRFNCLGCHDWEKLVASDKTKLDRADLKEKPDHQAVLDGTAKENKICTDCHGEHRLNHRTRRWDKRTSKLIYRDNTPQMLSDPSASNLRR